MRFGHCEKGLSLFIVGIVPLLLILYINRIVTFQEGDVIPLWYNLLIVIAMFMMFMGIIWIILHIRTTKAFVMLDETQPEEVKVFRITRDGIILAQFAPKGLYGTVETIVYGEDADFEDMGEFPLRSLDGSPSVLVFDMLNTVINPVRSVARKYMKHHISDGIDGYKLWKRIKKEKKEEKGNA